MNGITKSRWARLGGIIGFGMLAWSTALRADQAIGIGTATKVFDSVQYDEPFLPAQTGAPWTEIDSQLTVLAGKLPYTASYLRSFYADGKTVWWFVDVTLKPAPGGTPPTDVIITGPEEQVAANLGGVILVRKDIWANLSDDDKATLLMHEMLWSAVGGSIGDGTDVVLMSRYLLNPNLSGFSALNVMAFLQQMAGSDTSSQFQRWLAYDQAEQTTIPNFKVDAVAVGLESQLVISTLTGPYQGLQLTVLRPNTAYTSVDDEGGTWFGHANGVQLKLNPAQLCSTLRYAGFGDWRLPTQAELAGLDSLNFLNLQYPTVGAVFARPTAQSGNQTAIGFAASDGIACLEEDLSCQVADGFLADVPYLCVRHP
jgi:hypothetical protein